MIRAAAVSGTFYPQDGKVLLQTIDKFLKNTSFIKTDKNIKIVIVPHAGYDYSGQTAAWGFKQLEAWKYSKIIILGVSHQAYFTKAAIYNQGFWKTPLGEIDVDENLANKLIQSSNLLEANLEVHEKEHSIEVELPFLQKTFDNFKIVPILLGQKNQEVIESLSEAIYDNFDDNTLLVISSDLSHYPSYDLAKRVDQETINMIIFGDIDRFSQRIQENLKLEGVETCACGSEAIKTALLLAKKMGIQDIRLINYSNSGDVTAQQNRVVGYASIGFYGDILKSKAQKEKSKEGNLLNQEQQQELLKIARQTLEGYLKTKKIPELEVNDNSLKQTLGVFVTLKKNGELRGCIGEFEPTKPLFEVIQDKVIDSALHDSRFNPISPEELKDIKIEISVLSPKEEIQNWRKIELGKHGVIIKQGIRGGTFLPQVATDTDWDLETFLSNLCYQKAGLSPICYLDPQTKIFVYTAQVFSEE